MDGLDEQLPATPAGRQLVWVLENLRTGFVEVSDGEVEDRFAPTFLRAVPAPLFRGTGRQIAEALKGFGVERIEAETSPMQLVAVIGLPDGEKYRASIIVQEDPPNRIEGLLIQLAHDLRAEPAARTWEEFLGKLKDAAPEVAFLAAEVVNGEIVPIREWKPDVQLAIGSAFKLYVLGALAREVEEGRVAWTEKIPIQPELKSWPSGEMRELEDGTEFSVQHYAEQMISVSDNTATDHLLHRVGRERVEEFQTEMGHSKPVLNQPFLSTREMSIIKARQLRQFMELDAAGKRRMLGAEIADMDLPALDPVAEPWSDPRYIQEVEWFASANDLARAMAKLKDLSGRLGLEPLRKILSINPGAPFDKYAWTYIGYKGGSEPGVLNMTWLLGRLDERWFVLTATLNSTEGPVQVSQLLWLMLSAGALLVMHRKSSRRGLFRKKS